MRKLTPVSARYADAEHFAVIVRTREAGEIVVSPKRRKRWRLVQGLDIAPYVPPPVVESADIPEAATPSDLHQTVRTLAQGVIETDANTRALLDHVKALEDRIRQIESVRVIANIKEIG